VRAREKCESKAKRADSTHELIPRTLGVWRETFLSCARVCVCVCGCVRVARERERERCVSLSVGERERDREICVCVCVCMRERCIGLCVGI